MALGGFHPGFKDVPPGFPDVARLQLALTSNPLFNVSCRSYLAIVANTVQFGAALDVSAEISGFRIAGGASFDALVEFVETLTRVARGRAYYASPTDLGTFVFRDYIRNRRKLFRS